MPVQTQEWDGSDQDSQTCLTGPSFIGPKRMPPLPTLPRNFPDAVFNLCKDESGPCFDANSPPLFGTLNTDLSLRRERRPPRACGGLGASTEPADADGPMCRAPRRAATTRSNHKMGLGVRLSQRMKGRDVQNGLTTRRLSAGWLAIMVALVMVILAPWSASWPALAQDNGLKFGEQLGPISGLPLPRFVSLKADRVNLREGPSRNHRTTWVFQRAGLPVEVTAEFDVWRKVRDSEGTVGWVLHTLLSGRRTALVAPWKKGDIFTLLAQPDKDASPVAKLQSGVIASLKSCDGNWCHVSGTSFDGYIQQTSLWGVYPNEKIN